MKRRFDVMVSGLVLVLATARCGSDSAAPTTPPVPSDCNEAARARAADDAAKGVSADEVRRRLEIAVLRCAEPNAPAGKLEMIGQVNADLARAGGELADGTLSGAAYLDLVADRTGKLSDYRADSAVRDAFARGDKDGDLIPDDRDRCPDTPRFQPTDRMGCPLPAGDPTCPSGLASCGSPRAQIDDAAVRRAFESTTFMVDSRCNNAQPRTPTPLAWGRGTQAPTDWGFNMMMTKIPVDQLGAGCDLFYEVEIRFASPGLGSLPPIKYVNVMFRASEDLHPEDQHRAFFGVPVQPAPPGQRGELVTGFSNYHEVQWRTRAVTGNQIASPWSGLKNQGPAAAGVF